MVVHTDAVGAPTLGVLQFWTCRAISSTIPTIQSTMPALTTFPENAYESETLVGIIVYTP